jgi:hypothetical protein
MDLGRATRVKEIVDLIEDANLTLIKLAKITYSVRSGNFEIGYDSFRKVVTLSDPDGEEFKVSSEMFSQFLDLLKDKLTSSKEKFLEELSNL